MSVSSLCTFIEATSLSTRQVVQTQFFCAHLFCMFDEERERKEKRG